MDQVMDQDILECGPDDSELGLRELWSAVAANWRLMTVAPLLAGAIGFGVASSIPPTFTAKTLFLPPQQQQSVAATMLQSLGSLGGFAGAGAGIKNPGDQYVAFLRSASLGTALVDRFKLQERYKSQFKSDALRSLEGQTRITNGKDGLITIEVDEHEPVFAAQLANAYVEELGKLLGRLAVTEPQRRRLFFEKQLHQAKQKLTAAQIALQGSGLNEGALRAEPKAAADTYAAMKARVTEALVRLQSLQSTMTEEAPEFRAAQENYFALQRQLTKIEAEDKKAQSDTYISKYREFKYQEMLFELFSKQYEVARVDEAREGALVQVLDVAQPPDRKSKPKRSVITLLFMGGATIAAALFVFVRQSMRKRGQPSAIKPD